MEPLTNPNDAVLALLTDLTEAVGQLTLTSRSEDLALKDYSLGLLAELGQARSDLTETKRLLEESRSNLLELNERLAREMTRAYEAEKRNARIAVLEVELSALHASFTWKLGRFFMIPIRLLRRLQGR